jgi:hypothetical protein
MATSKEKKTLSRGKEQTMSDRLLKESDVLKIAFQLPYVVNSAFFDAVKALPSADRPQGEWIPCEKRLPSEEECIEWIDNNLDGIGYFFPL